MKLVKDYMTDDFKILNGDLSPQEAIASLAGSRFGVIENADRQAIGVVTKAEIEAIAANATRLTPSVLKSMPCLKVGCEIEMQRVIDSPLLPTIVQENKVTLVIGDSKQIVGVLPVDAISQFIQSGFSQVRGITLGPDFNIAATGLAGSHVPPTAYFICHECWYFNEVPGEQWADLQANVIASIPCQNPNRPKHPLKLD